MKQRHFIDSHKGVTGLAVLALIAAYGRWEQPAAWLYLAMHGTYGILWVLKGRFFPDRQWEQRTGLGYGLVIWAGLTLYWIAPWVLVARGVEPPAWWLGLCASLYAFGLFFHFAADMQKHTTLRLRPGLMTDGLWARCRNPNYFGELLIYLGFGLLPMHWAPLVVLGLFIAVVWLPNMRRKDRSLARYAGFEAWKARSSLFIPFLF